MQSSSSRKRGKSVLLWLFKGLDGAVADDILSDELYLRPIARCKMQLNKKWPRFLAHLDALVELWQIADNDGCYDILNQKIELN